MTIATCFSSPLYCPESKTLPVKLFLYIGHSAEIRLSAGALLRGVLGLELLGQVVERFYGLVETRDGQEGGQVSRVGGDHDETKDPPRGGNEAT